MDNRTGPGFVAYRPFFVTVRGRRFGFEYSRVGLGETPYLDRYIVYLGGLCVRLHKFWRGDDDRAPHDHPWNFWTFPLRPYYELVPAASLDEPGTYDMSHDPPLRISYVKAWRLHYRPAKYRHIVMCRADGSEKPFWTFVVTGRAFNKWGFWPEPNRFVPWREWR